MAYTNIEQKRAYGRAHYRRNKRIYKARAVAHTLKTRKKVLAYVDSYLRDHPCVDCGEADIIVLEFDHRDRKAKRFSVSDGIWNKSASLRSIKAEIAKCDVRCANCHRRKTHRERMAKRGQARQPAQFTCEPGQLILPIA